MPKIDITMNSVYDSGKIRGYCTATIDNSLSIRGIKFEKLGEEPTEVKVILPQRENNPILSMFDNEFPCQLKTEAYYSYCTEIGVDMTVADPIENTQVNCKKLDVLVTKLNENPNSNMKAMANVTIDNCFSVNRVEVRDVDGILEVQMPQRKTVDGYKEICSLTNDNYEKLFKAAVLDGYTQRLEQIQATTVEVVVPALSESTDYLEQEDQEFSQENQETMEEDSPDFEEEQGFGMGGMNDGN